MIRARPAEPGAHAPSTRAPALPVRHAWPNQAREGGPGPAGVIERGGAHRWRPFSPAPLWTAVWYSTPRQSRRTVRSHGLRLGRCGRRPGAVSRGGELAHEPRASDRHLGNNPRYLRPGCSCASQCRRQVSPAARQSAQAVSIVCCLPRASRRTQHSSIRAASTAAASSTRADAAAVICLSRAGWGGHRATASARYSASSSGLPPFSVRPWPVPAPRKPA